MNPDDFRRLAAAGLSTDQIALVMEMMAGEAARVSADFEAQIEASKEKGRERWRKWKSGKSNAGKRLQTTANVSQQLTGVEDKTLTTVIEPQEKKDNPEHAFAGVLSPEVAREVVAHRKAMKKPLTAYGAGLLAKQIAKCPDPTAAAEAMIANGWQGVKPEYMRDRSQSTGPPPGKPRSVLDAVNALNTRMEQASADSAETIQGTGAVVLRLSAAQQR